MDPDGHIHRFAHLDSQSVQVGDTVTRGSHIGSIGFGGEGVHLHYEKRVNYLQQKDGTEVTYQELCKLQPHVIKKLAVSDDKRVGQYLEGDSITGKDEEGKQMTVVTLSPNADAAELADLIHRQELRDNVDLYMTAKQKLKAAKAKAEAKAL